MSTSAQKSLLPFSQLKLGILAFFTPALAMAQDVPADLLDLSIEELFQASIRDELGNDSSQSSAQSNRWRFSWRYQHSDFDGYKDGSRNLSLDEVMFQPGLEPRTEKNFPVVPSFIDQDVHALGIGYVHNESLSFQAVVPYITQSTDHFSVVPGYARFIIESEGIGDVALLGTYRFRETANAGWLLGFGLSLPTGSIDEVGDTPRAPGDQQLPYSMQVGSGTFDIPLSVAYSRIAGQFSWGGEISGRLRLGENDRNYRLGNRFTFSSWLQLNTIDWIRPSLEFSYEYSDKISGIDREITVPMAFQFPAPVTNPTMYGGRQANLVFGLAVPLGSGRQIDLDFGKPIYQSLNGPQVSEDYRLAVSLNLDL